MPNKIDSNVTGLAYAEEVIGSPKTLPGTPIWRGLEPNSYSDFGGQISTVARDSINPSRQRQKGTPTDYNASGGFNLDITQHNIARLMQGFMFANAREKAATAPYNGTQIAVTGVTATQAQAASGLTIFKVGDILLGRKFGVSSNNGPHVVSAVSATTVTASNFAAEASPPVDADLQAVGFQFTAGDATFTVTGGVLTLGATAKNLTDLGLSPGDWTYLGGDATITAPGTSPTGYARVATVTAAAMTFDKVTATFATDAMAGKTLQIFFGKFIRNESGTGIVTRSYNIERQLGNDGVGIQSQYLEGAVANEMTINLPTADKLTADLSFIATDSTTRTGAVGIKTGTRVAANGEDAFNTSSKVVRSRMSLLQPGTLQPSPLFAYITDANITINNNANPIKAVGVFGAMDVAIGNFEVGGSVTAYFTTLDAVSAVRNNADVTLDLIFAQKNAGIVIDLPLLSLGNGRLNVAKDQPITIPLDLLAAQGVNGYTLGIVFLPYLPTIAVPQ